MAETPPTGTLTLMFSDIESSTELWERMGDRFRPVLDRHNQLVRDALRQREGYEVKSQGDSFMAAFERGTDAIRCAVEIQRALLAQKWPEELDELRVRIGIHTGEPFLGYDADGRPDYFGPMVNRAARIAQAGHGGQIVISSATRDSVQGTLTADLELVDLGRHRLRGLEQPELLFELRPVDLPHRHFPPLRTLDLARVSLPTYLTAFVGRDREVATLQDLLDRPETRLLTLTGPGGVGKTRLAHAVASHEASGFDDGVWLVDLADVREPENVAARIAAVLPLATQPDRDTREQLLAFLRERSLLLVLDSFERVVGAALLLTEILSAAPRVKCLVTSQIALRLRGEQVYRVSALPAPDSPEGAPEELLRCDSVALFVERARAARPEFALTAQNASAVVEICRRLDGLPLAIELAAAQLETMSAAEVLDGLRHRLDLPASESPDLPERHRTLTGALGWSYALLDGGEQSLLQQLSVFSGGCSRDAVAAVCGSGGLDALRALHRHSLVNSHETDRGRTRYWLLTVVAEYARAKLDEQEAESRSVRVAHAHYYLQYAEERVARMRTPAEVQSLDELQEELDNLRGALTWAEKSGQEALCARLAVSLYEPLYRCGFWEEAGWCLQIGWRAAERGDARGMLAALGYHRASLASDRGDVDEARRQAETSLAIRRELGDGIGTAESLNLLGYLAIVANDLDAAEQYLTGALSALPHVDDARRGMALHNQALLASRRGDDAEARRLYEESLVHERRAGDGRHEAGTLSNLGALAQKAGAPTEARRLYRESLSLLGELRDRWGIAVMLNNLGELAEADAHWENAVALFVHAEAIFRELGSALADVPAQALRRLASSLLPDQYAGLLTRSRGTGWQEWV